MCGDNSSELRPRYSVDYGKRQYECNNAARADFAVCKCRKCRTKSSVTIVVTITIKPLHPISHIFLLWSGSIERCKGRIQYSIFRVTMLGIAREGRVHYYDVEVLVSYIH